MRGRGAGERRFRFAAEGNQIWNEASGCRWETAGGRGAYGEAAKPAAIDHDQGDSGGKSSVEGKVPGGSRGRRRRGQADSTPWQREIRYPGGRAPMDETEGRDGSVESSIGAAPRSVEEPRGIASGSTSRREMEMA